MSKVITRWELYCDIFHRHGNRVNPEEIWTEYIRESPSEPELLGTWAGTEEPAARDALAREMNTAHVLHWGNPAITGIIGTVYYLQLAEVYANGDFIQSNCIIPCDNWDIDPQLLQDQG